MAYVWWEPAWWSLEGPTCNFQLQPRDCAQGRNILDHGKPRHRCSRSTELKRQNVDAPRSPTDVDKPHAAGHTGAHPLPWHRPHTGSSGTRLEHPHDDTVLGCVTVEWL